MINTQSIKRVQKNNDNPYVILNKICLNDPEISWEAKGLHAYLMSISDNSKIDLNELTKHAKDGSDGTSNTIKELEKFGYIIRRKIKNEKEQFIDWEYLVFETPVINVEASNNDKP